MTELKKKPNFDIKLKTKLKDFQVETTSWMKKQELKHDGGMLLNEAGLGKSICLLALIIDELKKEKTKKTLIICPAGVIDNWINEINKHTTLHKIKYVKYHGQNRREKKWNTSQVVYITSYSVIAKEFDEIQFHKDSLFEKIKFDRIILDEAHYIRNPYTHASKSILYLSNIQRISIKRWIVTATPIFNTQNDAFNYFRFVKLQGIDTKSDWTNEITNQINGLRKLNTWMKKYSIALKKEDVFKELKSKIETKLVLQFNSDEQEFYDALQTYSHVRMKALVNRINHLKSMHDNELKQLLRSNVLTFILRLRQAADSPWLILKTMKRLQNSTNIKDATKCLAFFNTNKSLPDEDCPVCYDVTGDHIAICGHKLCKSCWDKILDFKSECPVCKEHIDIEDIEPTAATKKKVKQDNDVACSALKDNVKIQKIIELTKKAIKNKEKIIVVSQWVSFLDIIRDIFSNELPKVKYISLQGNKSIQQRTESIKDFESNKNIKVCFISLNSSAEGINLISANHVIFCEKWWNQSKMIQAENRIHRIGQTKQVYVYNLQIENTIEQKIEQLVDKKYKISNLISNKWTIKNTEKYDASWITSIIKLLEPAPQQ